MQKKKKKKKKKKDVSDSVKHVEISKETYEGRTESHEQQFFSCELGTADKGE